jgi:hypothetical protein
MEEKIVGLIPMLKKPKSFGRWDSYAVIITDQRTIFAQLTSKMLKDAAMEAQRKGKEEGKGFFSRWADQIKAASNYSERYLNIPPEEALHENPGNFAIPNQEIKFIEIKKKRHSGWSDETEQITTEIKFVSAVKKESFNLDGYSSSMAKMLKDIFGDRLKT